MARFRHSSFGASHFRRGQSYRQVSLRTRKCRDRTEVDSFADSTGKPAGGNCRARDEKPVQASAISPHSPNSMWQVATPCEDSPPVLAAFGDGLTLHLCEAFADESPGRDGGTLAATIHYDSAGPSGPEEVVEAIRCRHCVIPSTAFRMKHTIHGVRIERM